MRVIPTSTAARAQPRQRATSDDEALELLRREYDTMLARAKRSHDGFSWATLEGFLAYHRCRCGRFGHV